MCPQEDVWILCDKKSILHLARRMIFRKIKRREIMPVILNLRTVSDIEPKSFEDLDDPVPGKVERMKGANSVGHRRQRQVDFSLPLGSDFGNSLSPVLKLRFGELLELVKGLTRLLFFYPLEGFSGHQITGE